MKILSTLLISVACARCVHSRSIDMEDELVVAGPGAFEGHWKEAWKTSRKTAASEGVPFHGIQPGSYFYNKLEALAASRNLAPPATDTVTDDPENGLHTMLPAPGVDTEAEALEFLECGTTCTPEEKAQSNSTSRSIAQVNKEIFAAKAIELKEKISVGALAKVGALNAPAALKSFEVVENSEGADWEMLAVESRRREHGFKPDFLKWAIGINKIEESQRDFLENKTLWESTRNATEVRKTDLKEWLESKMGKLGFVRHITSGLYDSHLEAEEMVAEDELVVDAPMMTSICLITSIRINTKRSGYLDAALKDVFRENEEWGVAMVFLHEYFKDLNFKKGSKWGPFVRSLQMKDFSTAMTQELTGTYAVSLIRKWNAETAKLKEMLEGRNGPCKRGMEICSREPGASFFNYEDIQWALWVTRQHAIPVHKKSNNQRFLALVPYAHLLQHDPNAGGRATFEMDGAIRVYAGRDYEPAEPIRFNFGNLSDSETLLRYHYIPPNREEDLLELKDQCFDDEYLSGVPMNDTLLAAVCEGNSNNFVVIKLPGVGYGIDEKGKAVAEEIAELTHWRDQMKMPPRLSDLHRAANELKLLGEDGKERELLNNHNKLLAGLPISTGDVSLEDQLMMLGKARNIKQARKLIAGGGDVDPNLADKFNSFFDDEEDLDADDDEEDAKPQLYPAPDVEDDPHARTWMERLSNVLLKVKESIQAGAGDRTVPGDLGSNATQTVINASRAFIEHGVVPPPGMDPLDFLLMKKVSLLKSCGDRERMTLSYQGVSPELMCAMRVHFMNETELDIFCPAESKWYDYTCESMYVSFNATVLPISYSSELDALQAILDLVRGLLARFPTSLQEDVELLRRSDYVMSTVHESIVRLRVREKWLLESVRMRVAHQYRDLMKQGDTPIESVDDTCSSNCTNNAQYQIHQYALNRREIDQKETRIKEIFRRAKRDSRSRKELASLTINIKAPNGTEVPTNVTVHPGESLHQVVKNFIATYSLSEEAFTPIVSGLKAQITNLPILEVVVPVITTDGHRRLIGLRQGQTPKEAAELFCARWTASLKPSGFDKTLETIDEVTEFVEERWNVTMKKRILAQIPIDSPDGRLHHLVIREGVHHDLLQWLIDWCTLHDLGRDIALQIHQAAKPRLPTAIINIPIQIPGRRTIVLTLLEGSDVEDTVDHFCEMYDLHGDEVKINMRRALYSGMSPGSKVLN